MREAITFFIEMILISGTFFLGHKLIFRYSAAHFRRIYLLAWLSCSAVFPLISLEVPISSPLSVITAEELGAVSSPIASIAPPGIVEANQSQFTSPPTSSSIAASEQVTSFNWQLLVAVGYSLVALILLLRIVVGYFQILNLKKSASVNSHYGNRVFEVSNPSFKGASFFNWVFIGNSIDENRDLVLNHEFAHRRLRHSFDILAAHLYCAVFWVNPFAWVLKKTITINTELETDAQITQTENRSAYANLLVDLSRNAAGASIMNHLSAKHLKVRIIAMKSKTNHRKWVYFFTLGIMLSTFLVISCSKVEFQDEISMEARLYDVKTITTYFTSHQSDTQQKTGKMVSRATFLVNGELVELINKTSYPYDAAYESKREFWQQPIKKNLPYVMDGLSLGVVENNLLYGNNWPAVFVQTSSNLDTREKQWFTWKAEVEFDDYERPTEVRIINVLDTTGGKFVSLVSPDKTTFYKYEDRKISEIFTTRTYPEIPPNNKLQERLRDLAKKSPNWKEMEKIREESGKKKRTRAYTYDGENLTRVVFQGFAGSEKEYRLYYEENVLTKSEYYITGTLINSRVHYYEDGLKQRTEIFNVDNEPEYTITYEYEFWK